MATLHQLFAALVLVASTSDTVAADTMTQRWSSSTPTPRALGNYSNGLNVVKRGPEKEEEYVTSFYKRVRDKRRAMFGKLMSSPHDEAGVGSGEGGGFRVDGDRHFDHSLDHYFDHQLSPPAHRYYSRDESTSAAPPSPSPSPSSAARSVRGGGATPRVVARPSPSSEDASTSNIERRPRQQQQQSQGANKINHHHNRARRRHHSRPSQSQHPNLIPEDDGDRDTTLFEPHFDEYEATGEGDDYPDHHRGLLRVPCSIAINAGEASLGHRQQHPHGCSSQDKTSVAAYVDTGAQVTVISASAARRAGIYHLMDRRYAGRATGVGHCKVLGRIPARHVYFILGHEGGCRTDEDEDEYRDDDDGMVEMDGPALTVLEGTVTQGVDVLLGLDVLQDWEAEIRMGPKRKSITVKKRRGGSSVVIPFASPAPQYPSGNDRHKARRSVGGGARRHHHHRSHLRIATGGNNGHGRHAKIEDDDISFDGDEDFSPADSDIESDLDLLDQSGHEFPEEYVSIRAGERLDCERDEDEDYLKDVEEEEDIMMDGEEGIDMSGL